VSRAARVLPLAVLALVTLAAADAHACSVCFSTTDQNRWAFIGTTVFMSVLPLAFLLGVGAWLRHKVVEMERRADAARATAPPPGDVRVATLPRA
jgi:hypothetical protein